jgi:protoporphyrinogen oxidase
MSIDCGKYCSRILILGAGCTGLGAAYRLHELGYANFLVLEANSYPGGLSASFVDNKGFTWDLGGHVQFSHYEYFDRLMERALGNAWFQHVRQSYIWTRGTFVPYPFQNNLRHLPPDALARCIKGVLRAQRNGHAVPSNFREWILQSFGEGIADLFLLPYNFKVWAHPAEMMDYRWVGERVATVDVERLIDNVILACDEQAWGPNSTFRFPARGGTGAIWDAVARLIPESFFRYNTVATEIDADRHIVRTAAGEEHPYDVLISTLPLDTLAGLVGHPNQHVAGLKYATTHVVGVGLAGQPPEHVATKNWMYFPEGDCPFYRVTVLSNYSPNNVPDSTRCWSLMAEVSESPFKPVNSESLVRDVIQGMTATRLICSESDLLSVWHRRIERGYPVPTINRDDHLATLLPSMENASIFSRGRFGAWKYEVANQDHTCMQGVELVDRLLLGTPEMTVLHPAQANASFRRVPPTQVQVEGACGAAK